jgi:hypothetical protein
MPIPPPQHPFPQAPSHSLTLFSTSFAWPASLRRRRCGDDSGMVNLTGQHRSKQVRTCQAETHHDAKIEQNQAALVNSNRWIGKRPVGTHRCKATAVPTAPLSFRAAFQCRRRSWPPRGCAGQMDARQPGRGDRVTRTSRQVKLANPDQILGSRPGL